MDINNRDEVVAYFAAHDIVAEQADNFIRFWKDKHPRSFEEQADKWIERSDQCYHISTQLPTAPPPPEAGTKLIPPSVWYAEMKREEARRLAEYEAIHGKAIPMPMHMRRHKTTTNLTNLHE